MFERICRENGVVARNTKPRSPTTTGKVERFHQTLQRELFDHVDVWADLQTAQAAVDAFRTEYNTNRPHQALDMEFAAARFASRPADERLPLRLPTVLTSAAPLPRPPTAPSPVVQQALPAPLVLSANVGDPVNLAVQFTRVVPRSGNLTVCSQQFWLGPDRAGSPVMFWADSTVVHLLTNGVRLKTVPSRLTTAHLQRLLTDGGQPAGPPPILTGTSEQHAAIEVDRLVNATGAVALAGRQHPVGYHFAGRRLLQLVDDGVLMRSLPNPLTAADLARLRDARPRRTTTHPSLRTTASAAADQRTGGFGR